MIAWVKVVHAIIFPTYLHFNMPNVTVCFCPSFPVLGMASARLMCRLASAGIPEGKGVRARCWQLLLGYLPPSRDAWQETLDKRRKEYASFCEDFALSTEKAVRLASGHLWHMHMRLPETVCMRLFAWQNHVLHPKVNHGNLCVAPMEVLL